MSAETKDYEAIIEFLYLLEPAQSAPHGALSSENAAREANSSSLGLVLKEDYHHYQGTGEWRNNYQLFVSGWPQLEGVMILTPTQKCDADLEIEIAATNERALKDLLLSFPRGKVGLFRCKRTWMINGLTEMLTKYDLPKAKNDYYPGIKRGSEKIHRSTYLNRKSGEISNVPPISKRKDPVVAEFRQLASLKGRLERSKFVVEGMTLVMRAVVDGLPVETILFTPDQLASPESNMFFNRAYQEGVDCHSVNSGVMESVTATRPVPQVMAAVHMTYRDARDFYLGPETVLLIVDSIANPDNLGMVLRTGDAAGVDGIVLIGKGASPFHKNCIRASRGAVGRIPLLHCSNVEDYFKALTSRGFSLLATSSKANKQLYELELSPPLAFVIGNENEGIRKEISGLCTDQVVIPMAPGQSSLNVGVAAGVLLYEQVRRREIKTSL